MAGTELISALAGAAGTVANPLMQSYQNRWNQRMMEQQNKWNIEQWNRENAYNLPYNQVSRLQAAGINPALAFANGDLMNEAAASPAMQASQGKAPQIDPMALAQIDLMRAQAENLRSQTDTENAMRQSRVDNLNAATANLLQQNEESVARIRRLAEENKLTQAQIDQFKFDRVMQGKRYMLDRKYLENNTNLTVAEIKKLNADARKALADAKVTEREYQEMVWTYAIRKLGLQKSVDLTQAQIDQAEATARKLGIESDMDAPMSEIRRRVSRDMSGENGRFNQITSIAVYGLYDVMDNMCRVFR